MIEHEGIAELLEVSQEAIDLTSDLLGDVLQVQGHIPHFPLVLAQVLFGLDAEHGPPDLLQSAFPRANFSQHLDDLASGREVHPAADEDPEGVVQGDLPVLELDPLERRVHIEVVH